MLDRVEKLVRVNGFGFIMRECSIGYVYVFYLGLDRGVNKEGEFYVCYCYNVLVLFLWDL